VLLRLKLPETWKHLPFRGGSEFVVVWFSFVYVLLDSVLYGCWADVQEKIAKIFVKMYTESWKLPLQ